MLKIYTNDTNPATLKLLIAANYAGKSVNVVKVLVNDRMIEEPRHLPVVEFTPDCNIFIVNAALNQILPPTKTNASDINEWLEWESTTLTPVVAHIFGSSTKSKQLKDALATSLEKLEAVLNKKLYLVGDSISICDISIWSTLYPLFKDDALSKEYLTNRVNILKFMTNLEQQEQVKKALNGYSVEKGNSSYQALLNGAKYLLSTSVGESPSSPSSAPQAQLQSETTVTEEEILAAEKAWAKDASKIVKHQERSGIVLPKTGEDNILITSALPYVNNVPHLGNIIGCVLSADVFARFSRLCNKITFFLCGTDEYGTATETKALEEKLTCQEICDKYHKIHNEIYQWFNISFDHFGRTSTAHQKELCQDIFLQLHKNGFMFTQSVEQLHCENCNKFLADRFVEGGCPNIGCTYEDARGDQCDGCGKLVNAVELKNPRCKTCGQTPVLKTSEQFFMDLPKLEPQLRDWVKESSPGWSNNAQVIAKAWLKEGLKPRCITRDLKWGVSVPLKGYTEKVFYVWFDAPIGYMSISKAYSAEWLKWWQPEKNTKVTLYHFMAKDNVPFHSIMFPATLLGCKRGYTTVSHIMATEYLNYEDGKFSKSRGVGVFGTDAKDTGIISDVWRFYLLYVRPESQDSSFSWADLVTKNNSELLNNLGNFINRGLVFCKNNFNKVIPKLEPTKDDYTLLALCTKELKGYISSLEKCKLRDGIRYILAISKHGNQYMQSTQPWVLLKGSEQDQIRAGTVIGICCNISCLLATLLHPYMPETSDKLFKQLNTKSLSLSLTNVEVLKLLPEGHTIGEPYPLFAKIEPSQVDELKAKYGGVQSSTKASDADIKKLEDDIAKQGLEVRKLKESGAAKTVVQPQVDKLLALKAKLAAATGDPKLTGKTAKKAKPASNNTPPQNNTKATESEIKTLEEEVAKQALEVRKLKEGGAVKTVWQPEVEKLLALKAKLTAASGDSKPAAKVPTKKEKPVDTPQANGEVKNDIKAIEEMVAAQAAVVRKLKEGGSDKLVTEPEVKKLLDLKAKLVEAGGAPAPPSKGKKSKKNK